MATGTGTTEILVLIATETLNTGKVTATKQEDAQYGQDDDTKIICRFWIIGVHELSGDEVGKVHGECIVDVHQWGIIGIGGMCRMWC